jgi:hypothetical protein
MKPVGGNSRSGCRKKDQAGEAFPGRSILKAVFSSIGHTPYSDERIWGLLCIVLKVIHCVAPPSRGVFYLPGQTPPGNNLVFDRRTYRDGFKAVTPLGACPVEKRLGLSVNLTVQVYAQPFRRQFIELRFERVEVVVAKES